MNVLYYGLLSPRLTCPELFEIKRLDESISFVFSGKTSAFNEAELEMLSSLGPIEVFQAKEIGFLGKVYGGCSALLRSAGIFNIPALKREVAVTAYSKKIAQNIDKIIARNSVTLVHFHFLSYLTLRVMLELPKRVPFVANYWGSDLMVPDRNDILGAYYGRKALLRADRILIHTVEMRQIMFAKFGYDLYSKTILKFFGISNERFQMLDRLMVPEHTSWSNGKSQVIIGYSATTRQQHLEIVRSLRQLKEETRSKLHLVFPISYGNLPEEYINALREELDSLSFSYRLIREYLSQEDIYKVFASSDIFINCPFSDAMNAAMIEMLYMGKVVINGAWLPYGTLRRRGIHYYEVENFGEIPAKLCEILENRPIFKNRETVKSLFSAESTANTTLEVYESLNN